VMPLLLAAILAVSSAYPPRHASRRAKAEKICKAQGPRCRVLKRPGQPRDLTGVACVCS
jgi:hypothetical protein